MDIDSVRASIAGFPYRRSAEKFSRLTTSVRMTLFFCLRECSKAESQLTVDGRLAFYIIMFAWECTD